MSKRPLTEETITKIKDARDEGKNVKQIMSSHHVSESTVTRHTKKKSWHIEPKKLTICDETIFDYKIFGSAF